METRLVELNEFTKLLNHPSQEDIELRIKYFIPNYANDHIHFVAFDGPKIVGILALQLAYSHKNCFHIEYISVDKEYRDRAIGTSLVSQAVLFCKAKSAKISTGQYSEDGESYMRDVVRSCSAQQEVELIENA
jgi:ribosomal protein S18 acetylase RimI-like enzyme